MEKFDLYRRRLIPNECILLAEDRILSFEQNRLVTVWDAIHPKKNLHHGISCFFLDEGIKMSKFYRQDNSLVYWYIDIISAKWSDDIPDLTQTFSIRYDSAAGDFQKETGHCLVVTDLLADVLLYPDGQVRVVDLAEISDALESGLLDVMTASHALRLTDRILKSVYDGSIREKQSYLEAFESPKP